MGGTSSSSQTSSSQMAPYSAAAPALGGLLNGVTGLSNTISNTPNPVQMNAIGGAVNTGNALAPAETTGALGLLNGGGANNNNGAISSGLSTLQNGIVGQTATGANIGANSGLAPELAANDARIGNNIAGQWAAAGRQGSPGEAGAIAYNEAQADAPIVAGQYNTDTTNALNAANTIYGAGNTTYGMLNNNQATANSNLAAGANLGSNAMGTDSNILSAEGNVFGIPASEYQTLLGTVSPIAQAFGTQSGTQSGTSTMSPAQQFALIAGGLGGLWPKGGVGFGNTTNNFGAT
jgi:hypothetical protein